jgi:nuclear pore complex protein Nup160
MELNPQTGAPVVESYRRELKLDWLSIWANVRDLDRQSRWPVTTAVVDDQVTILAREGVSVPIPEDVCAIIDRFGNSETEEGLRDLPEGALRRLYPSLAPPQARAAVLAVSSAGAILSHLLAAQDSDIDGSSLEGFVFEVNTALSAGVQLPVEALAGQLWDDFVDHRIAEEDRTTLRRILSDCLDIRRSINETLGILADMSLPLTVHVVANLSLSGLGNALLASAISQVVSSRYSLARNVLLVALFQLSESRDRSTGEAEEEGSIEILTRAMAIYHRYRVLKWVCERTGEEARARAKIRRTDKRKINGGDDVLADGLGGLNVREADESLDADRYDVSYSLVHSLLAHQLARQVHKGSVVDLLDGAERFLEDLGVVEKDQVEVEPQVADVRLAHGVLVDGHPRVARGLADLYPDSAGMVYIRGRAFVEEEMVPEAVKCLEQAAAGCKGELFQL